jgi:hypothetical protein
MSITAKTTILGNVTETAKFSHFIVQQDTQGRFLIRFGYRLDKEVNGEVIATTPLDEQTQGHDQVVAAPEFPAAAAAIQAYCRRLQSEATPDLFVTQ